MKNLKRISINEKIQTNKIGEIVEVLKIQDKFSLVKDSNNFEFIIESTSLIQLYELERWTVFPKDKEEFKIIAKWFDENFNEESQDKNFYSKLLFKNDSFFSYGLLGEVLLETFQTISFEIFQSLSNNLEIKKIKIIAGYKSPIDLFEKKVPKGSIFYWDKTNKMYYPHIFAGADFNIKAKEIVESWEPFYKEEIKVGDWVYEMWETSIDRYKAYLVTKIINDIVHYNPSKPLMANKDCLRKSNEKTIIVNLYSSTGNFELIINKNGIYYSLKNKFLTVELIEKIISLYCHEISDSLNIRIEKLDFQCHKDTKKEDWENVLKNYKQLTS